MFRKIKNDLYLRKLISRGLKLGNNVFLNDGFFIDPAHCHLIEIGDDVVFGPGVSVFAHDASSKKVIGKTKVGLVRIARNAFIGARSVILPGSSVGEDSILAAQSLLSGNVPAAEVWGGNPARKLVTVAEYKQRLESEQGPEFTQALFSMGNLNHQRRAEMIDQLSKTRFGFMLKE